MVKKMHLYCNFTFIQAGAVAGSIPIGEGADVSPEKMDSSKFVGQIFRNS